MEFKIRDFVFNLTYIHVEIYDWQSGHSYQCSEDGIKKIPRMFGEEDYDFYGISGLTSDEEQRIVSFCEKQIGKPYNTMGVYLNYLFPCFGYYSTGGRSFYCTEYVIKALKKSKCKEFSSLDPYRHHVDDIFRILNDNEVLVPTLNIAVDRLNHAWEETDSVIMVYETSKNPDEDQDPLLVMTEDHSVELLEE